MMPKSATPSRRRKAPKLQHHRATGQARVRIDGKDIYLGEYGSPEAEEGYYALIAEWVACGYRLPVAPESIQVIEVCARYVEYADSFYLKNGEPTSTLGHIHRVVKKLRTIYGRLPAVEFTPRKLKALRQLWIDDGCSRATCNYYTGLVKRIFRWAVSEDMIPADVYSALATVEGLRKGRSAAKDSQPVLPVAWEVVEAALPKMPRPVAGLVLFQWHTGCRPGEAMHIRMCDVDKTDTQCWVYRPASHKTQHHNKTRAIAIGPKAIELVNAHAEGKSPWEYVFSPFDAIKERSNKAEGHRRDGQPETPRKTDRKVRPHYDSPSYAQAIHRACDAAGVDRFAPNQLRHSFACAARDRFGLDGVQASLGHANAKTSEIYAQVNLNRAIEIAREIG